MYQRALHEPLIGTWTQEAGLWAMGRRRTASWSFNTSAIAAIDGRVFIIPFSIESNYMVRGILSREGTSSNSCDWGIYDEALQLLIATGNANRSTGTNFTSVADTLLVPGTYYFATSANATDNLIYDASTFIANDIFYAWQYGQRYADVGASGNPLPADLSAATWVDDVTSSGIFVMGITPLAVV